MRLRPMLYALRRFFGMGRKEIGPLVDQLFEEFDNRTIYRTLTTEILREIPDQELDRAIIDYIDVKVDDRDDRVHEIVTGLSAGFCAVYTTWWVEAEVANGGFNQYFWNSSGRLAEEAVAGFELIGAPGYVALMRRAIDTFRQEEERLRKFMDRNTPEAFSESYEDNPLNEIDQEFCRLEESEENLKSLRIRFIRRRPDLFVGD